MILRFKSQSSMKKEEEATHVSRDDFSNWIIKSKYQRYYLLVIPLSLFLIFTSLNYFYLNGLRYVFSPVDVVDILSRSDEIPSHSFDSVYGQTFRFDKTLLIEILKDIYVLREEEYLSSKEHVTISIEPEIIWSAHSIALNLREGLFNFSTNSVNRDNIAVSHMVSRTTYPSGNYFDLKWGSSGSDLEQTFIRQFLYSIFYLAPIPPSDYNVDALIVHFLLGRISNCGILTSAVVTLLSLSVFECFPNTKFSIVIHVANCVMLFLSSVNCFIHSIVKLVVTVIVDFRFPTMKYHFSCLFVLMQIFSYIFIYSKYFIKYKDRLRSLQESYAMQKIMLNFEPSPEDSFQGSSIYSPISEKEKVTVPSDTVEDSSAEIKGDTVYSAMSLDPLRQDMLDGFNFSPNQEDRVLPKTAIYRNEKPISPPIRNHTAPVLITNSLDKKEIQSKGDENSEELEEDPHDPQTETDQKPKCINPYSTPTSYVAPKIRESQPRASSIFAEEEGIS